MKAPQLKTLAVVAGVSYLAAAAYGARQQSAALGESFADSFFDVLTSPSSVWNSAKHFFGE